MKIHRWFSLSVILAALTLGAVIFGCSKSSKAPTNPGGGGGPVNLPFDTSTQASGFVFNQTFPAAGSVSYKCTPHASLGMTGSVTISASAPDTVADVTVAPGGSLVFSPVNVSIKPGGHVHWVWASGGHSVTSVTITAAQEN